MGDGGSDRLEYGRSEQRGERRAMFGVAVLRALAATCLCGFFLPVFAIKEACGAPPGRKSVFLLDGYESLPEVLI